MSIDKFKKMSPVEEKLLSFVQMKVNELNPNSTLKTDPARNVFLKEECYKIREELFNGNGELVMKRRDRLKRIFLQEAMDQEKSMRELGYAYIPTQP